jgi:pyridoxine 5-phosphate synthase
LAAGFEYNVEGNPTPDFLDLVASVRPEQCTLVPDAATAFTSDKGWNLDAAEIAGLAQPIKQLKSFGSRVILFVDPNLAIAARAADAGADGIAIRATMQPHIGRARRSVCSTLFPSLARMLNNAG